jgi:hypothetical protein
MKLVKMVRNKRSNPNKEFEHDEELWLISAKNKNKMHLIECVSIVNPFQMKSMKVICMRNTMNKEFEHGKES